MSELDEFVLVKGLLLGFTEQEIQVAYKFIKKYCENYHLKPEDILYDKVSEKEFTEHLRRELNNGK